MIQTQERTRSGPRGAVSDGTEQASRPTAASGSSTALRLFRTVALPLLLLALAIVGTFGYVYWLDQVYYITTDNAQITGAIAHVASPAAGQVRSVLAEVGDPVYRGQVVATVGVGVGSSLLQLQLRAPVDGVVVAVNAVPGDVAVAGRPLATVVDPASLYVLAQIDETKVGRVQPGQVVDVTVDSLGTTLSGRVTAVGSASATALSQAPPANSSGYFVKIPQLIPVRIDLPDTGQRLVAGGSAVVRIRVVD